MLGTLLIKKERISVGNRLHMDVDLGDLSCSRSLHLMFLSKYSL